MWQSEAYLWCGLTEDVVKKIEMGMLKWFGEKRLMKEICRAKGEGNIAREGPRRMFSDQFRMFINSLEKFSSYIILLKDLVWYMTNVGEAREVCHDSEKWRSMVSPKGILSIV